MARRGSLLQQFSLGQVRNQPVQLCLLNQHGNWQHAVYECDLLLRRLWAFDRVSRKKLMDKLRAKGVREDLVQVFAAWLGEREALVVVGGKHAAALMLENMIYQGTVWGPWLWNVFYEDAKLALHKHDYTEIVFADDLNAFREFDLQEPTDSLNNAGHVNRSCTHGAEQTKLL